MMKKTTYLFVLFVLLFTSVVSAGYYNSNPNHKVCDSNGCNVVNDYPRCWINHYWSKDNDDPTVIDILLHRAVDKSSFEKSCGAEQIDVACEVNGELIGYYAGTWKRYDHDCGDEPKPEPKVCGDGKINQASEECDEGSDNGDVCTPGWNSQCTYCTTSCKLKTIKGPICTDECSLGQTMCKPGDDLWKCGDFDSDPCLEWGFKESCDFSHESDSYYVCENEDSVEYKEVGAGFCNDKPGYNDFCDSTEEIVKVDTTDCGYTTCDGEEFCQNDDVYSNTQCVERGCKESTGLCFQKETSFTEKEQDCGEDSETREYCDGENIVYETVNRGCTENNGYASCFEDSDKITVSECGPDICTPYTELDPYVQEYVYDEESCIENGYAYCSPNDEEVYDMCITSDILWQAYCAGEDSAFQEYDCSQKDGCYPFEVEQCFKCEDNYGNCYEKNCTITGMKYRDYFCGSGACQYEEKELVDEDRDFKDDEFCDDCIDVDRDGICDDDDNCPGVKNSNQIDYDKDGVGNMCDQDRDNDGYSKNVDCNDWDPEINPGMREIPNNNIDDDCNPDTTDYVVNTAREALYVDIQMAEEYLEAGQDATILVTVRNMASKDMGNVQLSISMPRYQIYQRKLLYELDSGEAVSRIFEIRLPENLETDYEYLRVSVSSNQYKRIIYREIKLPN